MNKKAFTEADVKTKLITPAIKQAGWDIISQMKEEHYFTAGKIQVQGQKTRRLKGKKADYILYYRDIPIAVIEAKDNTHSKSSGIQQALDYANILNTPFAFSSNGDGFLFHDRTSGKETELEMNEFPSPEKLWSIYKEHQDINNEQEKMILQDYHSGTEAKEPRYYQRIAINKAVEAISKGKNRLLLVMATGTGKTYVAFQIIYKLWKAKTKKRILFLADRNILVDQTRNNDFAPFKGAMTKIKGRVADPSYEIHLALYQAITGEEEQKKIFKDFSKDFFDLIVIDECHRGSAKEDSSWREILEYFSSATQIGLTATPKETKYVSNINYFGKPIYTYSLKQGIEDGFLAPYKVIRIDIDKDIYGWRPKEGQRDKHNQLIEDREFTQKDMDKSLVLEKRTQLVAQKVTEFLEQTDIFQKTIIFCEDIDHAERMRQVLINQNSKRVEENSKYIMKITGDDEIGKNELENFIHPEKRYPVVVTTSKLLTTGVDAKTCKLIVLDKTINSMSEFKQIIGRGTRVDEEFNKMFFTIMDFKRATKLFSDPNFDGEPVEIYEPNPRDSVVSPKDKIHDEPLEELEKKTGRKKYYIKNQEVEIIGEEVKYIGKNGKLMTESFIDWTKKAVLKKYPTLDNFTTHWKESDKKTELIEELKKEGLFPELLKEKTKQNVDIFDLINYFVFGKEFLTKEQRIEKVKNSSAFSCLDDYCQKVMNELFKKYYHNGIDSFEDVETLKTPSMIEFGTSVEIINKFNGPENYIKTINQILDELY